MRFESEKDLWLSIVIWASVLIALAAAGAVVMAGPPGEVWGLLIACLIVLVSLLPLWFWFATYYVLLEDRLIIKHGPFEKTVFLAEIRSVKKTSNPLAGPALSLNRLEIACGKRDFILISPKERDVFLRMLAERLPDDSVLRV